MPIALLIALAASLGLHTAVLFGPELEALELPGLHDESPQVPPLRAELMPPTPAAAPPAAGRVPVRPRRSGRPVHGANPPARPAPLAAVTGDEALRVQAPGGAAEAGSATAGGNSGDAAGALDALHAVAAASLPDQVRIRYAVFRGEPGFELGRTELNWDSPPPPAEAATPRRYRAWMSTETAGLAALIKPVRVTQESQGDVTPEGLKPRHFFTARDGRRQDWADFDWGGDALAGIPDGDTAQVSYAKGDAAVARGAQDFLSLFFQFAWLPGFPLMPSYTLTVATGKKISEQLIVVQGEETVELPAGTFRTLHVKTEDSEPIELWLALDYHALPVKMRYTDRRGDRYDQLAVDIRSGDVAPAPSSPASPPAAPNGAAPTTPDAQP